MRELFLEGLDTKAFFKRTRAHIRTLVEVAHECFPSGKNNTRRSNEKPPSLCISVAATCFLQSLLKNQCRVCSCFSIIDLYIAVTLNDILCAKNLLVFFVQFFTGSGSNCEKKKLNSKEALGTIKGKKQISVKIG